MKTPNYFLPHTKPRVGSRFDWMITCVVSQYPKQGSPEWVERQERIRGLLLEFAAAQKKK